MSYKHLDKFHTLAIKLARAMAEDVILSFEREVEVARIAKELLEEAKRCDITDKQSREFLTPELREKAQKEVFDSIRQNSFGDGMEDDYARGGCIIVGAMEMSDDQLVEEMSHTMESDDPDTIYAACYDLRRERDARDALQEAIK